MHRCRGFTLLEICLAVAIALVLVGVAAPSVQGVLREQRLHRVYENFDALVAHAQTRSVQDRRTLALVWKKDHIELMGLEKNQAAANETSLRDEGSLETFPIGSEQHFKLERPAALGPKPPDVWTFWRSGACEPVLVSYQGPEGAWKVRYDALTARRTILEEQTP